MKSPIDDLENRLPVWEACSELYLDTELEKTDFERIGSICSKSPYTMKELNIIMFNEVWPAFSINLMSVAGEWRGWTSEAVKEAVLESYSTRWRLPWRMHPLKRFFCKDWDEVLQVVKSQRANTNTDDEI